MLYPLTFKPILKKVIWGGSDICPFKGISPVQEGIGESWELSHVDGDYSIVAEGELADKSLDELIKSYGKELLGAHVMERFGTRFPLLIKFIDARDNLSIQVHLKHAITHLEKQKCGMSSRLTTMPSCILVSLSRLMPRNM